MHHIQAARLTSAPHNPNNPIKPTTPADGTREDPVLSKFEEEIGVCKAVAAEVAALPSTMTINYVKINAKPLRNALTTWASKWVGAHARPCLAHPTPAHRNPSDHAVHTASHTQTLAHARPCLAHTAPAHTAPPTDHAVLCIIHTRARARALAWPTPLPSPHTLHPHLAAWVGVSGGG